MFKSDLADIGTIAPGQEVEVKWELIGDPSEVIHYVPDCGCTANSRTEGNFVVATFTESDALKFTKEQIENYFPSGKIPITKGIMVYFKDEHDLWVIEGKIQKLNPSKKRQKINFIGYVDVSLIEA